MVPLGHILLQPLSHGDGQPEPDLELLQHLAQGAPLGGQSQRFGQVLQVLELARGGLDRELEEVLVAAGRLAQAFLLRGSAIGPTSYSPNPQKR